MQSTETTARKENIAMRALYLIAAIVVVDGHTNLADLFQMEGLFRYYSYHLLLFAFGSGYFFKDSARERPVSSILHKAKRLLIPLYIWNLIYGLGAWFLRRFGGFAMGEPVTLYNLLIAPLTDGHQFVWNLGSWFVFPLFLTQVIYTLMRCGARLWRNLEPVTFAICLFLGCAAVEICRAGAQSMLPLFLLRTLILLPGYAGGVLYRRCLEKHDKMPTVPYLILLLVIRALLCTRYENLAYLISSCDYFGCDAFGVYFGGAIAIAFMLRIARLIAPYVEKSRLALYVSRHTFDVMMHHYMGFFALNCVFLALHMLGLGAADFSVNLMRNEMGYAYTAGGAGRAEWDILYLLAGLLFPMIIAFTQEKIIRSVQKKLRK